MMQAFSQLPLQTALTDNLDSLAYSEMTDVQAQTLPDVLNHKDVIVQAKTGSGKTAVFGLGILNKLKVESLAVQALVLCPTRELADQVAAEIRSLARGIPNVKVITLCGGVSVRNQVNSLEHGAHIVVGTPGRIQDHLDKGTLNLQDINHFVLDEADRMLDMGFQQALDDIHAFVPENRQTLLFSATYPPSIAAIADRFMNQATMVKVAGDNEADIEQHYYQIKNNQDRMSGIQLLILKYRPESVLVFCNTKVDVKEVTASLQHEGFNVLALHGDLEQKDRDQTLIRFANKSATVLVATDVAARGLDIDALDMVINYHVASDVEVHLHRIGRTGRAGNQGTAHSFYADKESYKMERLSEYLNTKIVPSKLPKQSAVKLQTYKPPMMTLRISGGKKQKLRAGDILGALTRDNEAGQTDISGDQVGKINLFDFCAYVAVNRDVAQVALNKLRNNKLKGKTFKIWLLKEPLIK